MLLPPTRVRPPEVIFVVAPAVLPEEICRELNTVELFVAWIVIVLALLLRLIPAPETRETLEEEPFRLKLVAVGTEGPIIEIVLADVLNVILLPPIRDTLPVKPFKLNAAPPPELPIN